MRIVGLTQKLGKIVIYRHHIEPKSSTNVPKEGSFLIYKIYIIERNLSEKKFSMREWDRRKAKTSEATSKFNYVDIAGKGPNSVLYYNFT